MAGLGITTVMITETVDAVEGVYRVYSVGIPGMWHFLQIKKKQAFLV